MTKSHLARLLALLGGLAVILLLEEVPSSSPDVAAGSTTGATSSCIGGSGLFDYPVYPSLEALARGSTHVIQGTVLEVSCETSELSGPRGTFSIARSISTVRVERVFKGILGEETITVGQAADTVDNPTLWPGDDAVLFLWKIEHAEASYTVPYDYYTQAGPQGKFLVRDGTIEAKDKRRGVQTTEFYQGMSEADFIRVVETAVQRQ